MSVKRIKVLFVGNSYTFFNKMPQEAFTKAALAAGYEAEVTEITKGGYRLCQFADPSNEHGIRLREAIAGNCYDFAVLQEQSLNPIKNEAEFLAGVEAVRGLIDADSFVLYATWGRNDHNADLEGLGISRKEMTDRLSTAYNKAGALFGMGVAEVGRAFWEYSEKHDKDALYHHDGSHPSPVGSELAAEVIFSEIKKKLN